MTISPNSFADVSRRSGIPLWNPEDPSYFVQDSMLGANPYMSDYIRFHIPLHSGVEKAMGDPIQYAQDNEFSPSAVQPLRSETGKLPTIPSVTGSPEAVRIKTGTTPGGMSGAINDYNKVDLARKIHEALDIDPRSGTSRVLALAGIGPHRIRTSPGIGAWSEGGKTHMAPYFAVDVPANNQGEYDPRIGEILSHIFQQTALGTEQHVRMNQRPNAIGVRGHFDAPLGHHRGMQLAEELVRRGAGFSPDIYHEDNHARAILYPGTSGEGVSEGLEKLMSPYAGNAQPYRQTGQLLNYGENVGEIHPQHVQSVINAANEVARLFQKHGARGSHIFGLRTGYGEFSPRPDVTSDPHVRDAYKKIADIRAQYGLKSVGIDSDVKKATVTKKKKADKKVEKVMGEFKRGTLKSGSGDKVTSRDQAVAIALSEAGLSKPDKG